MIDWAVGSGILDTAHFSIESVAQPPEPYPDSESPKGNCDLFPSNLDAELVLESIFSKSGWKVVDPQVLVNALLGFLDPSLDGCWSAQCDPYPVVDGEKQGHWKSHPSCCQNSMRTWKKWTQKNPSKDSRSTRPTQFSRDSNYHNKLQEKEKHWAEIVYFYDGMIYLFIYIDKRNQFNKWRTFEIL